jgi:hypothetical protein
MPPSGDFVANCRSMVVLGKRDMKMYAKAKFIACINASRVS